MLDKFMYNFFGLIDKVVSKVETYVIKLVEWCWSTRVKIRRRKK